jgi:NADH:ubiquinone oxidoreductase subunit 2 (subunit N)
VSLLPFLAVAAGGALLAVGLRDRRRLGSIVGLAGVAAAIVVLAASAPGEPLAVGDGSIGLTAYGRVLLGVSLAGALGVLVVGRLVAWEPAAPGVVLVAAAGLGVALGVAGALPGLLAAGATAALAASLALARPASPAEPAEAGASARVRALGRELRGVAAALAVGVVAVSLAPEAIGGLAVQPQVAGLAALAAGAALAHRFGAIPLHARVARLTDVAPGAALPTLLLLLPAAWSVILLAWGTATLGPAATLLGWDVTLLVILGLVTLVLGTLAALLQDDLDRIVAYTIVLDAGIVVLAFAALDPTAREAGRAWLVPFVASRTALVGWAIAFRAAFATSRLSEARGWLRRAPALGVALVGIGVAAVGWPGLLVWDARQDVLRTATGGPALLVATLAALGSAVVLARVLGAGLGRPEPRVRAAPGELARVPAGLRAAARALRGPAGHRRTAARAALREARPLLELNRTPLRALLVVLLAGLALLAAGGAFGLPGAAAERDLPIPVPAEPTPDLPSIATPAPEPETAP